MIRYRDGRPDSSKNHALDCRKSTLGHYRIGSRGLLGSAVGCTEALGRSGGSYLADLVGMVEHHPPEIAIVALIHLVFVLAAIALCVYIWGWFSRSDKASPGRQSKGPY